MRIVHISDWHASFRVLPKADIYVCTGDMLPNFPQYSGPWFDIDKSREIAGQSEWIANEGGQGFFRNLYLESPEAPVVVVRGNHDFIDLDILFDDNVYEIKSSGDTFTVEGLKFSGFRGINYIQGDWSDELYDHEVENRLTKVPTDIDVLLTHAPPAGILDYYVHGGNCGMRPLGSLYNRIIYSGEFQNLTLHCFGHIHEQGGMQVKVGNVCCSNAACNINVIDL